MIECFATQSTKQTHFWDQSPVFISQAVRVDVHRHRCYQIVIALTSTFDCTIEGQELNDLRGFIVNQNIPHACRVHAGKVLVGFLEADGYWGWQLRSWLAGQPYLNLADLLEPAAFCTRAIEVFYGGGQRCGPQGLKHLYNQVLFGEDSFYTCTD